MPTVTRQHVEPGREPAASGAREQRRGVVTALTAGPDSMRRRPSGRACPACPAGAHAWTGGRMVAWCSAEYVSRPAPDLLGDIEVAPGEKALNYAVRA
ncbi:hypothetical protein [Streptomyces sp. NBC_00344]|uniref:hypothetical protein n=1 Tax=Streptomyces sp. NBC_00344 TaxID=2975720 RepID=UPI002E23AE41